ncbi:hypothetical protein HanIR_Chr10g0457741 [Helianthus annuus]|nr:hypothetical protein HanIR_Chr10g0457741 [Helianthus annuus]
MVGDRGVDRQWSFMVVVVVVVVVEMKVVYIIFLIVRVFRSFHTNLTEKINFHPHQGLSENEIEKVRDYNCNFRKLGTKSEKRPSHRNYPDI